MFTFVMESNHEDQYQMTKYGFWVSVLMEKNQNDQKYCEQENGMISSDYIVISGGGLFRTYLVSNLKTVK